MSFWVWVTPADALDRYNREYLEVVYREFASEDERNAALENLAEEHKKLDLYSEPFGGDSSVYDYWSGIASKLGLPLITSIYQHGLKLETASKLEELEHELNVLEAYWDSHPEELHAEPRSGIFGQEREYLAERAGYLREAIRIAKEKGATLGIT